ncbi:TalC/MipB family fructose-6-phosphate aldolase [Kineothrix alysoides]|uniref:TalC/MipB family fructose-6-phosphate aldolase n=1 Tax=Kineothrix alysoides TaxID=1469948 RepID=A0A4R1QTP9_9FIRM|nr:transaldolase family protein [Kineothrix alysoides]TCL57306.1 TalC/MipB family fructose-6-phosphate aldolase [Kineothrix alysoides]
MKYIIDSAEPEQIEHALQIGACGITANPTMYKNKHINFYRFLKKYSIYDLEFLSGEVMGDTFEEMSKEAEEIISINKNIVIKINFSQEGLRLCGYLSSLGIKSAMTLIFSISQAVAASNAGASYVFPFVGRNEENGYDGLKIAEQIQQMLHRRDSGTKVVAASIKNVRQLEQLALADIDYAAIPYDLFMRSLEHSLTESGTKIFKEDWDRVDKEYA